MTVLVSFDNLVIYIFPNELSVKLIYMFCSCCMSYLSTFSADKTKNITFCKFMNFNYHNIS